MPSVEESCVSQPPFDSLQSFRRDHGDALPMENCVYAAAVHAGAGMAPAGSAGRWLVATVEPVDKTDHGWSVAGQALEALRQGFAAQYDSTVPQALARGFAAANACVRAANRGELGRRRGERVSVGAAAMAVDGNRLVFAHVPPSQIVFTQDRMVYSIPALHSWEPHYAGSDRSRALPLGVRDRVEVDLFQTTVAEQDTVILCSTSLGRAITGLPAVADRLRPPADPAGRPLASLPVGPAEHPVTMVDLGPDRPTGLDTAQAWVGWLDYVATDRHVTSCHAVAATMGQVESRAPHGAFGRSRPRERAGRQLPEPEPATPALTFVHADDALDRSGRPAMMHFPVPPVDTHRSMASRPLPGANGVRRFAETDRLLPEAWRGNLPRIQLRGSNRPPRWLATAVVLLVLLVAGTGVGYLRSAAVTNGLARALSSIDQQLVSAESGDDASQLNLIRGQLRTLVARHGASPDLDSRLIRLVTVEDRLLGRLRLGQAVSLGQLPAASVPSGRPIRLLHSGNRVFLVGTSLYELDRQGGQLIHLIGSGDVIDGNTAGPILDAVATRSGVAVTDGVTLFARDVIGRWTAKPIDARVDQPAGGIMAITLYHGQMVMIDGATGGLLTVPLDDTQTGGAVALPESMTGANGALDLIANDDLFVLGADGDLVAFDQLGRANAMAVPVSPRVTAPRAMDASGNELWILDAGDGSGRLIRMVPGDSAAIAYELPVISVDQPGPLDRATDFAIDAANDRIIFIAERTIWSVPLPAT